MKAIFKALCKIKIANYFYTAPKYVVRIFFILSFLTAALIQTACSYGTSFEEMLSPPKLTGEQSKIYQAFVKSKGSGFLLKYPKSGDYRSAFVIYDLQKSTGDIAVENQNSEKQAIVFYEASGINAERSLWLNFLERNDSGEWESVYDLAVTGTEIERIMFTELGSGGITYIVVCYSINQTEKGFCVIRYAEKIPERILEDTYTYLAVEDYFNEGKELLAIKTDYNLETSTALFYTGDEGQFVLERSCLLNPDAREYTEVITGTLNEKMETAVILNYKKKESNDLYGTDILVWRNGTLVNPVIKMSENIELAARRTNAYTELANPRDIDGDGHIELCSTTLFRGYSSRVATEHVYAVVWRSLNGNSLEAKYYTYYSEKNDYVFIMPSRWQNDITCTVSLDGSRVNFISAEKSILETTEYILSIKTAQEDEIVPVEDGWRLFEVNREKNLFYYIKCDSPSDVLALTEDELQYGFRQLSLIASNY